MNKILNAAAPILLAWATWVTVSIFAQNTADAVQTTKYDYIIEKLDKISKKLGVD